MTTNDWLALTMVILLIANVVRAVRLITLSEANNNSPISRQDGSTDTQSQNRSNDMGEND